MAVPQLHVIQVLSLNFPQFFCSLYLWKKNKAIPRIKSLSESNMRLAKLGNSLIGREATLRKFRRENKYFEAFATKLMLKVKVVPIRIFFFFYTSVLLYTSEGNIHYIKQK